MNETYDMPDQPPQNPTSSSAKSNRRGQNLSLADRARGGHNSAKQQRRDRGGRFAGAVKDTLSNTASKNTSSTTESDDSGGSSDRAGGQEESTGDEQYTHRRAMNGASRRNDRNLAAGRR